MTALKARLARLEAANDTEPLLPSAVARAPFPPDGEVPVGWAAATLASLAIGDRVALVAEPGEAAVLMPETRLCDMTPQGDAILAAALNHERAVLIVKDGDDVLIQPCGGGLHRLISALDRVEQAND